MIRSRSPLAVLLRCGPVLGAVITLAVEASCAGEGDAAPEIAPGDDASAKADDGGDASLDSSASPSCAEVDWCPVATNVNLAYTLTALWGSGDTDVWAVGSGGTAIHWAGSEWTKVPTNTGNTLLSVWGSAPNDVWAVSTTSTILHGTVALGLSTVTPAQVGGTRLHSIRGRSASDIRVAGDHGESGNLWSIALDQGVVAMTPQATPEPGFMVCGIWFGATDLWLVGEARSDLALAGVVLHATDAAHPGFARIDSQSPGELHGIWGSAAGDIWVVGASGTIRHFAPGAESFAIVDSPVTKDLHAVWGAAPDDIWAVGDAGTVIHFDGAAWSLARVTFGGRTAVDLRSVWGSGPNDVWAVGGNAALHFTGAKSRGGGSKQ